MASMTAQLIARARKQAGVTQDELARRAGTSRPTLSAYEHGRKSPTLETTDRLVAAVGYELDITPHVQWSKIAGARGQRHYVPNRLFRIPLGDAFASFVAPLHLEWSTANRVVNLDQPKQRARWYELVLREGSIKDIQKYIDGGLLIDAWNSIVLPRAIRSHWQELINQAVAGNV